MVRFDDSLPKFAALAQECLGRDVFKRNVVLRDFLGRLTLVLREDAPGSARELFDHKAADTLAPYVDLASATPEELFDDSLASDEDVFLEHVGEDSLEIKLIDRRVIGEDWYKPNFTPVSATTPVVVFFSCKGGVGRSTALAVTAASLSELGKSSLIFDFDLEAPGLGPTLLKSDEYPDYGALDYFVENGLGGVDDSFLYNCIADSPLTGGKGLVSVVPAVGRIGLKHPQNIVPKLGRAFLSDSDNQGGSISFLDQARLLIKKISERKRFDVILVDARAGMSESAAASILGLGGHVLLFGMDTPQTIESYRYLFAHLGRFALKDGGDWRSRLRMVHAKAGRGEDALKRFRDKTQELFSEYLYEEAESDDLDAFNFDIDDSEAPHYAWPIPYDADFAEFDPHSHKEQLSRAFFDKSFGPFVDNLAATIPFGGENDGR